MSRPDIVAVQLGRASVERHRRSLAELVACEASAETITTAEYRLQVAEQIHAEDLADLKRLTTNWPAAGAEGLPLGWKRSPHWVAGPQEGRD